MIKFLLLYLTLHWFTRLWHLTLYCFARHRIVICASVLILGLAQWTASVYRPIYQPGCVFPCPGWLSYPGDRVEECVRQRRRDSGGDAAVGHRPCLEQTKEHDRLLAALSEYC